MKRIGITGSLASGKSSAGKILGKKGPVFSADNVVKKLYSKKRFKKYLSKKLKIANSTNLKSLIKKKILKDKSFFKKLEKIIHPLVRKEMKKFSTKNKDKDILIFDIPLLVESKLMKKFDITVFVDCKKAARLKRFIRKGGKKSFFNILNRRQMIASRKRKFCDYKINNNKKLEVLKKNAKIILNAYE